MASIPHPFHNNNKQRLGCGHRPCARQQGSGPEPCRSPQRLRSEALTSHPGGDVAREEDGEREVSQMAV